MDTSKKYKCTAMQIADLIDFRSKMVLDEKIDLTIKLARKEKQLFFINKTLYECVKTIGLIQWLLKIDIDTNAIHLHDYGIDQGDNVSQHNNTSHQQHNSEDKKSHEFSVNFETQLGEDAIISSKNSVIDNAKIIAFITIHIKRVIDADCFPLTQHEILSFDELIKVARIKYDNPRGIKMKCYITTQAVIEEITNARLNYTQNIIFIKPINGSFKGIVSVADATQWDNHDPILCERQDQTRDQFKFDIKKEPQSRPFEEHFQKKMKEYQFCQIHKPKYLSYVFDIVSRPINRISIRYGKTSNSFSYSVNGNGKGNEFQDTDIGIVVDFHLTQSQDKSDDSTITMRDQIFSCRYSYDFNLIKNEINNLITSGYIGIGGTDFLSRPILYDDIRNFSLWMTRKEQKLVARLDTFYAKHCIYTNKQE